MAVDQEIIKIVKDLIEKIKKNSEQEALKKLKVNINRYFCFENTLDKAVFTGPLVREITKKDIEIFLEALNGGELDE